MAFDKILVAIDFSPESHAALAQAVAIAERTGSALELLWVDARAAHPAQLAGKATEEIDRLLSDVHAEFVDRLSALASGLASRSIEVTHRIGQGHPDEVIAALAAEEQADLVVTGTRGLSGLKRFFLGSVAEKVVRTSPTNVLVARGEISEFRRILVATDFSPASEKALRLATSIAPPGAEIELFHTWNFPPGTYGTLSMTPTNGPLGAMRDEIVADNEQSGTALLQQYSAPDRVVRFVQTYGAPTTMLQERLESQPYDLVAMGTHGYRGFRRFVLGSVAEVTVRHAPCSVLIAHAGDVAPQAE